MMILSFSGFQSFKDENNHEPTVQAQQYGSIFRANSALHHPRHAPPPAHMSPIEIGNYNISIYIELTTILPSYHK